VNEIPGRGENQEFKEKISKIINESEDSGSTA
jgi:hypothetical protein